MLLLNDQEDPPTFFSRRWILTSTPDLALATEDLSRKTNRKVLSQLAGSDHRPVLLAINLQYRPSNPKTFPRWNYKKADWEVFSCLTNEYCKTVKADHCNINKATDSFNQSILRAASETIPLGARKNYNNNNNNRIQRHYSRCFTISSQRRELSPTRTLKWPGRNRVQITCNTSSAYHVQVSCYAPLGTKGQLSY